MTRFTFFHGVAFADESGLIGVGYAPRLANGVATQTTYVVVRAELGIQILELLAYTTELKHLAYVRFASIVVVGRHRINICKGFFK
jgi:hypothetical protein